MALHKDATAVLKDSAGFRRVTVEPQIAALMGVEGREQRGDSLEVLRAACAAGVKSVSLTWIHTNGLGDLSTDSARKQSLSPKDRAMVREMNRVGIPVNLSHASDWTALQVLANSTASLILSHSSVRALCPTPPERARGSAPRGGRNGGITPVLAISRHTSSATMRVR